MIINFSETISMTKKDILQLLNGYLYSMGRLYGDLKINELKDKINKLEFIVYNETDNIITTEYLNINFFGADIINIFNNFKNFIDNNKKILLDRIDNYINIYQFCSNEIAKKIDEINNLLWYGQPIPELFNVAITSEELDKLKELYNKGYQTLSKIYEVWNDYKSLKEINDNNISEFKKIYLNTIPIAEKRKKEFEIAKTQLEQPNIPEQNNKTDNIKKIVNYLPIATFLLTIFFKK